MFDPKQIDYSAATEFVWSIFNVKKDQDLRIKLGYDVIDKVCLCSVKAFLEASSTLTLITSLIDPNEIKSRFR